MLVKNGRLIFKEEKMMSDLENLESNLRTFVTTDDRFCFDDVAAFVEYDGECWNEDSGELWQDITIHITNFDKEVNTPEGNRFATAHITFTSLSYEPTLCFVDGKPEFYFVFELGAHTVSDINTWDGTTYYYSESGSIVEQCVLDYILKEMINR